MLNTISSGLTRISVVKNTSKSFLAATVSSNEGMKMKEIALNPELGYQRRTMAENPIEIGKRITATKSIQKITSSMKMVSAAKLKGDEVRLANGKLFGRAFDKIFDSAVPIDDISSGNKTLESPEKQLVALLTSDRGLCGGVNSFASKAARIRLNANPNSKCFIMGAKGEGQMKRFHGQRVVASVDETWKSPINFAKASAVASRILDCGDFEQVDLVYNSYKSAIAYETRVRPVKNLVKEYEKEENEGALPGALKNYELEPEIVAEALQNFSEFGLSVSLFGSAVDNAAAEQSARMSAMENASKNAGEMIEKLTIQYNRARQAKITTELIEIISGAESLNKK